MEEDFKFLLFDRMMKIQSVIKKYGEDNFYISYSGGKDSTILSWLVDYSLAGNKIPRVYMNTGIEYNMIMDFVKRKAEKDTRFVIIKPSENIRQVLVKYGYPFKSKEHSCILDIYSRRGMDCVTVPRYLNEREKYGNRFRCPKCLEYQFTDDFKLKVSDKCCKYLKEKPLEMWAKENNKNCRMLGLMKSEGGRRKTTKCIAFKNNGKQISFHPLSVVNKEWEDWLIDTYRIDICDIYKPPYNFERTGCKGCPFAIELQHELDIMQQYFPREREQCERIWKPVYDEYRRIGYRLRKE